VAGLLSLQIRRQLANSFRLSETVWQVVPGIVKDRMSLGPVLVKGHAAPVQVYRLA
jgi:hypothetical protein